MKIQNPFKGVMPYYFSGAGTAGHVFLISSNGEVKSVGIGASPRIWPLLGTKVAVVPTGQESVPFNMSVLTKSNLMVKVDVLISVKLNPEKALSQFDFSDGGDGDDWKEGVQARAVEYSSQAARDIAKGVEIGDAVNSHSEFKTAIETALNAKFDDNSGVEVVSTEVSAVNPVEAAVAEALGAPVREQILTAKATAVHGRQKQGQKEATELAEKQLADRDQLAQKEVAVIVSENANKLSIAKGQASADKARLASFEDIDNGRIAAIALHKMAEEGVGTLNLTNDLLASITAAVSPPKS